MTEPRRPDCSDPLCPHRRHVAELEQIIVEQHRLLEQSHAMLMTTNKSLARAVELAEERAHRLLRVAPPFRTQATDPEGNLVETTAIHPEPKE